MEKDTIFDFVIETSESGQIAGDDLIDAISTVKRAVNKVRKKRGLTVMVSIEKGSTLIRHMLYTADGLPVSEPDNVFPVIAGILNSDADGLRRSGDIGYSVFEDFVSLSKRLTERYEGFGITTGDTTLEINQKWIKTAENKIIEGYSTEKESYFGKLVEADFREGRNICHLDILNGPVIKCRFPDELADDIANHIQRLNRDVLIKGTLKMEKRKQDILEIESITSQDNLFDETDVGEIDYDAEFLGALAGVPGTADDLTARMIELAWGDEG